MRFIARFALALSIVTMSLPIGAFSFLHIEMLSIASQVSAGELKRVDIPGFEIGKTSETSQQTFGKQVDGANFEAKTTNLFLGALKLVKVLISIVALLYIVIAGAKMVLKQGDEEAMKQGKMQIFHVFLAFIFFTVPGELLYLFTNKDSDTLSYGGDYTSVSGSNIFLGTNAFTSIVGTNLNGFLLVILSGMALLMFTYAAFLYLRSGDSDERRNEAKSKMIYGTFALVLLGFSQVYIKVVSTTGLSGDGVTTAIGSAFSVASYLIVPAALTFFCYAAYLMIFSLGDEERIKKGKSIMIYTAAGLFLYFGVFTILRDLSSFSL